MFNFSIPGLNGYFGGKGASNVPQQIINIIPPHRLLYIPFMGHCAITRSIKPAWTTYLNDKNSSVVNKWKDFFKNSTDLKYFFSNTEATAFLKSIPDVDDQVIYLDPPYLHKTRLSKHRYKHEMSREQHIELLNEIKRFKNPVLISHYKNDLYDKMLIGWNTISFQSQTRSGKPRTETVYFNYPTPKVLHDYSFVGNDYKSREHYKNKAKRLVAKWEKMTALERNFYTNALKENNLITHL